jgi:hypothetical protein
VLLAAAVDVLQDLGIPSVVGAAAGAIITHYAAKARGAEEHERTKDLLVLQDERRAAAQALEAARELRTGLNTGEQGLPAMHNEWQDRILAPARLVRDEEFMARARTGLYLVAMAIFAGDRDWTTYALIRATEDVEEWLEAWMRRDDLPPAAHVPPLDELRSLMASGPGQISFEPLNDYLGDRAG